MNWKMIDLKISGIKCDGCQDYYNKNVNVKEYKELVNKPCPKCGSNLLTEADFKTTNNVIFYTTIFNILLSPIQLFLSIFTKEEDKVEIPFDMDGSGKVKLKGK